MIRTVLVACVVLSAALSSATRASAQDVALLHEDSAVGRFGPHFS